ncbi:MAG: hypothetical protein AB8B58_18720 [Roseobacter sp.]
MLVVTMCAMGSVSQTASNLQAAPNTSRKHPQYRIYPCQLRKLQITHLMGNEQAYDRQHSSFQLFDHPDLLP